ncbi:hypothetical protein A3J03_00345 [Candidatus Uhrbacteria bacterium RIFCSPLOWO2_02_FULL_46_25]|nr:MAG: hypothetical protein A3J03_00345 [Candidatus Uhrbacteria bacterium RIFCSPLOWO2_02_FULL_46_25]
MRRGLSEGQSEALLRNVWLAGGGDQGGNEAVHALLRGEMKVILQDAIVLLVDATGRCIPLPTIKGEHVDANRDFCLVQPAIDYAAILGRLQQFFAPGMKFVSAEEFAKQATALITRIRETKQVANLLKGVCLPIVLPQITVANYGQTLEETFLTAAERAYQAQYPDRTFYNYRAGTLAGQVQIVEESRHQRLVEKMAKGPVVLIHFPNPMQGFSIPADRKMISALPEGFMLAGALDTATSVVAHTVTLARNYHTPGLDCAANSWRGLSLCFKASDDGLGFRYRRLIADDDCSGGLSFVG